MKFKVLLILSMLLSSTLLTQSQLYAQPLRSHSHYGSRTPPLFSPPSSIERALETARRLDVPTQEYTVAVTTAESGKTYEQLRGLGFTWQPASGPIGTLDESRSRVNLNNLLARSRSRSTQMVRVISGSSASIFIGNQVPVVTSQGGVTTYSTMDAGKGLIISAIGPSGKDGVMLGIGTESSRIVPTGTSLPAKRQFLTQTTVRAQFGKPVVLAMHETQDSGVTTSTGGSGIVRFSENRRRGFSTTYGRNSRNNRRSFGLGDITWRKQGSVGVQRRLRRQGGSTIITLVVRRAR